MIVGAFGFGPRILAWNQFAPAVQRRLEQQGVTGSNFEGWRQGIARRTEQRERDGEGDHLVHYALLSRSFTDLPPIEPALSAKQFVESGAIPKDALARMRAFQAALRKDNLALRLEEMRDIAAGRDFGAEYGRAMRFLYAKEFEHQSSYANRGHSTDTAVAANYAVWQALHVLRAMVPKLELTRILIVGPGLDFAPRTGLIETARPQSYQPFAVLDALLALGMKPVIHSIDINPRVIRFFQTFAADPVLELHALDGERDYLAYFYQLGQRLGTVQETGLLKKVMVRPEWARAVTAEQRNIVTEAPLSGYDLVIATNVLLYYEGPELTVAISNIAQSLKPGGYFLHNDLRPELDGATQAAGLEATAARTVRISAATYDSFALYRR